MPFGHVPKDAKLLEKTRFSRSDVLDIGRTILDVMDKAGLHNMKKEELAPLVAERLKMSSERAKLGIDIFDLRAQMAKLDPELVDGWGTTRIMRAPELQDRLSFIVVLQKPRSPGTIDIGPLWLYAE